MGGLGPLSEPMGPVLGFRGYFGGPGVLLGPLVAVFGYLSGYLCWLFWSALGAFVGGLGPLLGPMFAALGRLGAFVGGPGPSWAHSSVLCWRSWDALGTYVGGPGASWAEKCRRT